jgi:hypothetical protein
MYHVVRLRRTGEAGFDQIFLSRGTYRCSYGESWCFGYSTDEVALHVSRVWQLGFMGRKRRRLSAFVSLSGAWQCFVTKFKYIFKHKQRERIYLDTQGAVSLESQVGRELAFYDAPLGHCHEGCLF